LSLPAGHRACRRAAALAALALTGCVTGFRPGDDADGKLLFDCQAGPDAPHAALQILVPTVDLAGAPLDLSDVDDEPVLPSAAGEPTDEEAVVIVTNRRGPGTGGHCATRTDPRAGGARYGCATADGKLELAWPAGKGPAASAEVEVKEAWLFGAKRYKAVCAKKA
jgi:hypothetical protein